MEQNPVDELIAAIAGDIVYHERGKAHMCTYCDPDRRLLALLIAYSLGEELASRVVGNSNEA